MTFFFSIDDFVGIGVDTTSMWPCGFHNSGELAFVVRIFVLFFFFGSFVVFLFVGLFFFFDGFFFSRNNVDFRTGKDLLKL